MNPKTVLLNSGDYNNEHLFYSDEINLKCKSISLFTLLKSESRNQSNLILHLRL